MNQTLIHYKLIVITYQRIRYVIITLEIKLISTRHGTSKEILI